MTSSRCLCFAHNWRTTCRVSNCMDFPRTCTGRNRIRWGFACRHHDVCTVCVNCRKLSGVREASLVVGRKAADQLSHSPGIVERFQSKQGGLNVRISILGEDAAPFLSDVSLGTAARDTYPTPSSQVSQLGPWMFRRCTGYTYLVLPAVPFDKLNVFLICSRYVRLPA